MAARKLHCLLILSILMATVIPLTHQQVLPAVDEDGMTFQCENLTVITMCMELYSTASFPNYRDHQTQEAANCELLNFVPLIRSVCSNAIVHFLCSIYAPFCQVNKSNIRVRPCKELCLHVREGCEDDLRQFGLEWPPHLDCARFQPDSATDLDFCPEDIAAVMIPSNVPTDPPVPATTPGANTIIEPTSSSMEPTKEPTSEDNANITVTECSWCISPVLLAVISVSAVLMTLFLNVITFTLGVLVGVCRRKTRQQASTTIQSEGASANMRETTTGVELERVHDYEDIVLTETKDMDTFTTNVSYGCTQPQ